MNSIAPRRGRALIVGSVLLLCATAIGFVVTTDDVRVAEPRGSVTVRAVSSPTLPAAQAADTAPLLQPPTPPSLAGAVAAAPDAFIGDWAAEDGQWLQVVATGSGGYGVSIGEERYDGVLKDGRIHFPRGIDGDWLQATEAGDCLLMGSGSRFCTARP